MIASNLLVQRGDSPSCHHEKFKFGSGGRGESFGFLKIQCQSSLWQVLIRGQFSPASWELCVAKVSLILRESAITEKRRLVKLVLVLVDFVHAVVFLKTDIWSPHHEGHGIFANKMSLEHSGDKIVTSIIRIIFLVRHYFGSISITRVLWCQQWLHKYTGHIVITIFLQ